jgi:DNA-binding SARP family transcriptional activator
MTSGGADRHHRPRHGQPYGGRDVRGIIASVRERQRVAESPPQPTPEPPLPPEPDRLDHAIEPVLVPDPAPGAAVRRLADRLGEIDVLVRVLGEVEAVRGEQRLVPVRQKGLEAVAYLAVREAPVDREDLEINLFPDGANAAKTVYNTVSGARALVGDELFPPPGGGRYELSDRVVTDHRLFRDLVADAEAHLSGDADDADGAPVAAELLGEALGLVRGEPFAGVGRNYPWAGRQRGIIIAQVIDAAEQLVELCLTARDWPRAEWAARQGLRAFPADERMHRLLMRTAHAAGDMPGAQRIFGELCALLADPDLGIDPEQLVHPDTLQLARELATPNPPTRLRTA